MLGPGLNIDGSEMVAACRSASRLETNHHKSNKQMTSYSTHNWSSNRENRGTIRNTTKNMVDNSEAKRWTSILSKTRQLFPSFSFCNLSKLSCQWQSSCTADTDSSMLKSYNNLWIQGSRSKVTKKLQKFPQRCNALKDCEEEVHWHFANKGWSGTIKHTN